MRVVAQAVTTVVALVLGLLLVGPTAQAAKAVPAKVSVKASATKAIAGTPVRLSGTVRGRSARAVVALERRSKGGWVVVKTARVSTQRTYALRTTARRGATSYRVKVRRTVHLRSGASRVVTVRGVRPNPAIAVILKETNDFRAQHDLAPLKLSAPMSTVAQNWSATMAATGTFAHNPDFAQQIPSGWSRAGENIAAGQPVDDVVDAWIASPGHQANLLGDYTHIGIGYVSVDGTPYTRYFTQVFAKY